MKKAEFQKRKSLSFKLILVVCSVLIPVNILLILLSRQIIGNVQRELVASYRHELELYMTRLDDDLSGIDRQMKEFMEENWVNLAPGSKNYELARYQVWTKLKSARTGQNLIDAAYIKTNKNQWTAITYDLETMTMKEADQVKEYFTETDMEAYQPYHFAFVDMGGKKYLVDNINYYDYSFGMLTCADSLLKGIESAGKLEGEKICFVDETGKAASDNSGLWVKTDTEKQKLTVNGRKDTYLVICYPSSMMDYTLVRLIPYGVLTSEIPGMERGLQILCFFSLLLIPLLVLAIRKLVLKPLNALNKGMKEIEGENLDFRMKEENSSAEFQHMNHVFNHMVDQIHTLKIEAYERDLEKLRVESTNLRLQINPHLLLNSLNMIYSLAQSRNYQVITKYTQSLVRYFRYALRQNDELVPLRSEMEFVKDFLDIQKIRFPDAFTSVYEMDEGLEDALIPPLLIQNFVENSVKYALKMGETIEIILVIKQVGEEMSISIIDTGNGMKEEVLEKLRNGEAPEDRIGIHIGILNCRKRMKLFYGEKADLSISSRLGEGTQVWIRLPVRKEKKNDALTDRG